jgi:hypothetical protein
MTRLASLTSAILCGSVFVLTTSATAEQTQPVAQTDAQTAPAMQPVTQTDALTAPATQPDSAALPEGHPQLPSGHPSISGQTPGAGGLGSIVVKVAQGTQDGPAVTGGQAVVRLYRQGQVIQTMNADLDARGMAIIEGIALDAMVQPVVTLKYAGVNYESVGQPMGPSNLDQLIRLKVYETTEAAPAWRISMRHVMTARVQGYLHVTEVWAINNPQDRSYIGVLDEAPAESDAAEPDGMHNQGRTTLILPLPAGAKQVQPGQGFHGCCVKVEEGRLVNTMPLLPGATEFRVDYLLPIEDGAFNLLLATPAPTGQMVIFLPDDGTQVTVRGLETGDPFEAGEQRFRMYTAKQIEPGTDTGLVIQLSEAELQSAAAAAAGPTSQAGTIKLIAGVGAGLLVLAGAVVLLRPAKKPRPVGAAA